MQWPTSFDETTQTSSAIILHTSQSLVRPIISEHVMLVFTWIMSLLCQGISVFGIVTNIINIACFTSQGFCDPINVSLLGLAVSDLCSLITLLWSNICLMPVVSAADLTFDPMETQYIITGIPHTTFSRITGWITALITLERCLCIAVPLKVKGIMTTRRVTIIVISVFAVNVITTTPVFVVNHLGPKWSLWRNKTVVGLVFTEKRDDFEKVSFIINNAFLSFTSFIIIIISTIVLVIKLHNKQKWRHTSAKAEQAEVISNRNKNVAKMVVIISMLFIVCFVPISVAFLAMTSVPGLSIDGEHRYVLIMAACVGVLLEAINSSVNVFVYHQMSSKYREVFNKLFSLGKHEPK